jgi:hypothetical protein
MRRTANIAHSRRKISNLAAAKTRQLTHSTRWCHGWCGALRSAISTLRRGSRLICAHLNELALGDIGDGGAGAAAPYIDAAAATR